MTRISVIIVNYNGTGLIINCLKALERQSLKDFEIVIVDNGSLDDSLHEIRSFLEESLIAPLVKLIPLARNSGFAGGNLEGLRYARGEYIVLMNNDTEPDEKCLEELVLAMDSDPNVGMCASKLMVYGTDIIDSAGDGFSTSLKGFKRGEGEKTVLYDRREYVFGACAGAALYRRRMIEEIGFLDEDFFLIHEDTDLNFRAQLAGWKVMYIPSAIVYHKVRSTIGHMSDMAIYYSLRNTELTRFKNVSFGLFLRCLPYYALGIIIEFFYFGVKHKKLSLYLKAKRDAIRLLPKILIKRRAIMNNKKVNNRYLYSVMTPFWQKEFFFAKAKKFFND